MKASASRVIARAVEGSSQEAKLSRMVRRMVVREVVKDMATVILPTTPGLRRQKFNVPFGLRGKPSAQLNFAKKDCCYSDHADHRVCGPQPGYGEEAGNKACRDKGKCESGSGKLLGLS